RLHHPHRELILCAGGDDETYEIASVYAGEKVVILKQQAGDGKQGALRRCLERATGDLIFLTDSDSLLDDASFQATLRPLVVEGERAATGACRPLPRQIGQPFVAYQWIIQSYGFLHEGAYSSGLLGINCAIARDVLESSGGFNRPARTGTDYYLARQLLRSGVRIRMGSHSTIATEYPDRVQIYLRRQSRWLRNLLIHSRSTGDLQPVVHALFTGGVATSALGLSIGALLQLPIAQVGILWLLGYS